MSPCPLQDRRTQHVSNWLTVPLFLLAWPVALLTDNLLLTLAVFIGIVVAWRWGGGVGPADGKLMVGMAALVPPALLAGAIVLALAFLYMTGIAASWKASAHRSLEGAGL